MIDKNNDGDLNEDLSSEEFEELYTEENDYIDDTMEEDDSMSFDSTDNSDNSDLDFIEEDIEEVYAEDTQEDISIDETTAESEDDFTPYQEQPVKKKSSAGLMAIVVAVIAAGGAGAYFSGMIPGFGPSTNQPYQAPVTETQDIDSVDNAVVSDAPDTTSAEDLQDLYVDDPSETEALYAMNDEEPTETVEEDGFLNEGAEFAEEELSPSNTTEELFSDEPEPVVDTMEEQDIAAEAMPMEEEENVEEFMPQVESSPIQNQSASNNDDLENQISDLENRFESLQSDINSRLDNLQRTMSEANSDGAGAAMPAPDMSGIENDISDLQATLSSLTSRLDQMENKLESGLNEMQDMAEAAKSSPAPAPSKAEAAPAKPEPVKQAAAPAPKKPSVTANSWEIRAIQVGKAVIARKGTGETRNIVVGDSVPGFGTIQDINYKNGGWIIQGSSSSLKQ